MGVLSSCENIRHEIAAHFLQFPQSTDVTGARARCRRRRPRSGPRWHAGERHAPARGCCPPASRFPPGAKDPPGGSGELVEVRVWNTSSRVRPWLWVPGAWPGGPRPGSKIGSEAMIQHHHRLGHAGEDRLELTGPVGGLGDAIFERSGPCPAWTRRLSQGPGERLPEGRNRSALGVRDGRALELKDGVDHPALRPVGQERHQGKDQDGRHSESRAVLPVAAREAWRPAPPRGR